MGVIQGAFNRVLGTVAAAVNLGNLGDKLGDKEPKAESQEPSIDLQMREKALKQAQQKIDAINKQNLGRNNRMKAIRGVIDEFAQQDFTVKEGGSK